MGPDNPDSLTMEYWWDDLPEPAVWTGRFVEDPRCEVSGDSLWNLMRNARLAAADWWASAAWAWSVAIDYAEIKPPEDEADDGCDCDGC